MTRGGTIQIPKEVILSALNTAITAAPSGSTVFFPMLSWLIATHPPAGRMHLQVKYTLLRLELQP
jgi:hypothetical protein